jgi:NodT family efflux transporter outer membrane factor (OMF) lipoprotein
MKNKTIMKNKTTSTTAILTLLVAVLLMLVSACSMQRELLVEDVEPSTSFIAQGQKALDIRWWQSFNNEELTLLVEQAINDNLSLQASALRLKSSAIAAQVAGADLYPSLSLTSSATSKINGEGNFGDISSGALGLSASWELDIWGALAADDKKAYWGHKGQQALYRARTNLVAGGITNTWLSLISSQEKKVVFADQFRRTQDALQVISRRFSMGKSSVTNIWQQEKLLKSIEAEQAKNNATILLGQQSLALWLGLTPDKLTLVGHKSLPELPPLPEMGLPAQVLRFRPDIEQAFAKIKAANENLAIAIAQRYPRLTLRSSYSTSKSTSINNVSDLFDNWSGNLIAALALPLFDAGTKKAVVAQHKLNLQALVLDYKEVWLKAMNDVNKALINEEQLLTVASNFRAQLLLARNTAKLTTIKYLNGKSNYLNLLRAQENILSLERKLIDARKTLIHNRVLLYRELSHGDFSPALQSTNKDQPNKGTQAS